MNTTTRPARSRAEEVAESLRADILSGRFQAGDRLPSERDLAQRFGSGRGAVREAFRQLEQLGIARVAPGGARVMPLEESTLEAVGHLLDLQDPPDPELVEQVLDVFSALLAAAVRAAVTRASDEQLAAWADTAARIERASVSDLERHLLLHGLVHGLVDASGNLILRIIGRSLHTQFGPRLLAAGIRPPLGERGGPIARRLREAFAKRDARAASRAVLEAWEDDSDALLDGLRRARARRSA